jgi:hypothetical protein
MASYWNSRCRLIHLCTRLMNIHLNNQLDNFVLKLTKSRAFTVKSSYLDYMNDHTKFLHKYIWKMKVPLKIGILCGSYIVKFYLRRIILNWQGNKRCCFCDQDESIHHIFIYCLFAKIIWRIVHVVFSIIPPGVIIFFSEFVGRG